MKREYIKKAIDTVDSVFRALVTEEEIVSYREKTYGEYEGHDSVLLKFYSEGIEYIVELSILEGSEVLRVEKEVIDKKRDEDEDE